MLTVLALGLLAFALVLRFVPVALSPRGAGIDHWYWKTYVEVYRRERRIPPSLPQYILEDYQWYPPFFPWLLSWLPARIFDRFDTVIAIAVDLARMLLLLTFTWWRTGDTTIVAMAGVLYATSPIQVSYNIQLNPRGLAALMLDALLMLLLVQLDPGGPWWSWPVIATLSGLILLTHKMTTQLYWVLVCGTALIYRDWALLILVPVSIVAALALSRGFYVKVARAHWDIVSFWNRNWPWIGADLLRESPVYGDGTYERPEKLHRKGVQGVARQLVTLFGFNPATWIACLLVYERLWLKSPVLFFPSYLLVWLLLACVFACVTTFLRTFKCLGAGYLYLYNASLITSLLLGIAFSQTRVPAVSRPFILAALLCNVFAVAVYYRHFYGNKRTRVHEGLDHMIETLGRMPRGVVMCIPANWYEVVAYRTGQPVLWGAHGFGFRKIEPTWPRLLLPLDEIIRRYHVRYLLTMDGTLTPRFSAELPPVDPLSHGEYHLYCFEADSGLAGVSRTDVSNGAAVALGSS